MVAKYCQILLVCGAICVFVLLAEILHAFSLPVVVVTRQHEHVVSTGALFSKTVFPPYLLIVQHYAITLLVMASHWKSPKLSLNTQLESYCPIEKGHLVSGA